MEHSGKLLSYWDQRAAVRVQHRNYDDFVSEGGLYFFRPHLVPLLKCQEFQDAPHDVVRELQILQLSRYLYNTETMETLVINPALLAVQELDVSKSTKINGFKIYTDEAYHALMSAEVREKLHRETSVAESDLPKSAKQGDVLRAVSQLPKELRNFALIFVAAINETLISANLSQATDQNLIPAIREMIAHHAEDEAVHHVYFSDLFVELWPSLEPEAQQAIAPVMIKAMYSFLENDADSLQTDLYRFGYDPEQACRIAHAALDGNIDVRQPLDGTIKMLRRAGALSTLKHIHPEIPG